MGKGLHEITLLLIFAALSLIEEAHCGTNTSGEMTGISGIVLDHGGKPISGAMVLVVSPTSRTKPVYTDLQGHFLAHYIAPQDQMAYPSYDLEIYVNRKLIFREPLTSLPMENRPNRSFENKSGGVRLKPIKVG